MPQHHDIRERYASDGIENGVFYVPLAYLYRVRLGTVGKMLSWLFIYLLPCVFYAWCAAGTEVEWWRFTAQMLLVFMAVITVYELGYIFNDTYATRREAQPAIRLYQHNFDHFYSHVPHIVATRLVCAATFMALLYICCDATKTYWLAASAGALIIPLFAVYNLWRTKWNVMLYPVLLFSRYIPYLLLYDASWQYVALLFFSVPGLSMLERYSMPRHRFAMMRWLIPDEQSKTRFRVIYYTLALMALMILHVVRGLPLILAAPYCVLWAYRIAIMLYVRHHTPRNYLNG